MGVSLPVVMVLVSALPAAAQQTTSPVRTWWANVGAGWGHMDETCPAGNVCPEARGGAGKHVAVSLQSGPHVVSIRMTAVTSIIQNFVGPSDTPYTVTDFGILYGRGTTRGQLGASAGVGVGLAELPELCCGSDARSRWYLTLPLEAQVAWRPLRFLGVGTYAFASVNGEQSFWGLSFMLQAGRVR